MVVCYQDSRPVRVTRYDIESGTKFGRDTVLELSSEQSTKSSSVDTSCVASKPRKAARIWNERGKCAHVALIVLSVLESMVMIRFRENILSLVMRNRSFRKAITADHVHVSRGVF